MLKESCIASCPPITVIYIRNPLKRHIKLTNNMFSQNSYVKRTKRVYYIAVYPMVSQFLWFQTLTSCPNAPKAVHSVWTNLWLVRRTATSKSSSIMIWNLVYGIASTWWHRLYRKRKLGLATYHNVWTIFIYIRCCRRDLLAHLGVTTYSNNAWMMTK